MATPPTPKPGIAQLCQADRLNLPGMLPQECLIFKAWWSEHKGEYTAADFNVRVGRGYDPGPDYLNAARQNAIKNTQLRLDALLFRGLQPVVIEVKLRATPVVIGQLLSYSVLWSRDNQGFAKPELMLICQLISEDARYVCGFYGITVVIQPADLSSITIVKP